jgi:hypothetical protein
LLSSSRFSAADTSRHSPPSSSIACASVAGETVRHARQRSSHTSASAETPPSVSGHAPTRVSHAAFRYPTSRTSRPGRTIGPSLDRPAALMGFIPSQVCSRHGWTRISAHPGPHAFSFAPSDPIDFRRVDSPRPVWVLDNGQLRIGDDSMLASGLRSRLRSVSQRTARAHARPSHSHRDRSCLGLCLFQVCGHVFVHRRGLDPAPIISLRMHLSTHPIRSWASAILPD